MHDCLPYGTGFYIAIERNVDVKKIVGIKGEALSVVFAELIGAAVIQPIVAPSSSSKRLWQQLILSSSASNASCCHCVMHGLPQRTFNCKCMAAALPTNRQLDFGFVA